MTLRVGSVIVIFLFTDSLTVYEGMQHYRLHSMAHEPFHTTWEVWTVSSNSVGIAQRWTYSHAFWVWSSQKVWLLCVFWLLMNSYHWTPAQLSLTPAQLPESLVLPHAVSDLKLIFLLKCESQMGVRISWTFRRDSKDLHSMNQHCNICKRCDACCNGALEKTHAFFEA